MDFSFLDSEYLDMGDVNSDSTHVDHVDNVLMENTAPTKIDVEVCRRVTDDLVEAMNCLIPQLSSSSALPSRTDLEDIVASPACTLLLAVNQNNRIVGCLTLVVYRIPTGVRARIEDVVVDETVRGKRIAELLSTEALNQARNAGTRNVDLTSRPARVAANRLYTRMGFELRESNVYRYVL